MVEINLTQKQIKILHGEICPYCKIETVKRYREPFGWQYKCPKCGAYVGCHKGTDKALGRCATAELRKLRMGAHESFDTFWKVKKMKRGRAYSWLSEMLEIPKEYTHIGMFSESTCKKVIEICQKEMHK